MGQPPPSEVAPKSRARPYSPVCRRTRAQSTILPIMTLHLTKKNAWIWVAGVCGALLVTIGFGVPGDHWGVAPWKWIIVALVLLVIAGVTVQLLMQSKEDHDRDAKDAERDKAQESILARLSQLSQSSGRTTILAPSAVATVTPPTQPLNPPVQFDADQYFKTAYHSQFTADVERRIKVPAAQNSNHYSPEEFYAKFIGVGLVAYMHDETWAYIWRSQILMLMQLNKLGGLMPVKSAGPFYDSATLEFPGFYNTYTFEQWLNFVISQGLAIRHPSEMLEITVRGRDFLSFCAHYSRSYTDRRG